MELNVEQKKIIENKPNGHILIKGVAGSGKTTVAVNKIPFLLKNYCYASDDKVLMVTFNKSLSGYVKYIYENSKKSLQEEQIGFECFEDNEKKLDIRTIDSLIYKCFFKYKASHKIKELDIASSNESQNALVNAILVMAKKYPDVKILDTRYFPFIKDEILWIKACNYMELEEYQNADRLGRVSRGIDGPQKLRKNSNVRAAIFETMLLYRDNLRKINKLDFQDLSLLALEYVNENYVPKYTHIIIDESQDLTRVQLEFIKKLYNEKSYSSITFVADVAQSIYPQAWLVKNRSFSSIGFDMKGKSSSLSKNYRTTTQIALAAYSLIQNDEEIISDDNFVKPSLIDKQGVFPVYRGFNSKDDEGKYIVNLIKEDLSRIYDLKDIAIIARKNGQLHELKNTLDKNNIPASVFTSRDEFDFSSNTVKLVTMHSIKGLEFKVVIAVDISNKVMPLINAVNEYEDSDVLESRERKLLYVGMTRATEQLFLTSVGRPSKFIADIDYKYLRLSNKNNFRRMRRINIDDYLLTEQVSDLYSEEEKVRQWLIRELIDIYKYPIDLLRLEHQINIGSTIKYADGVVDIYRNKTKEPYIIFETKRWGIGLEKALPQLKSYLANSLSAQYGIATDGNSIIIINKSGEIINDIPIFDSSMIPSSLETYEFVDFKHNKSIEFIRDINEPQEIYVNNNGKENIEEEVAAVPIYTEIAAGMPILINECKQGEFYLPKYCFRGLNDLFILKIKGDSMINKNINDGDYVVINKQSAVDIGDIAAVEIDGNATLKTYKTMGGKVLLIPENDAYEPYIYDEEQVNVIGVAVGVIKLK